MVLLVLVLVLVGLLGLVAGGRASPVPGSAAASTTSTSSKEKQRRHFHPPVLGGADIRLDLLLPELLASDSDSTRTEQPPEKCQYIVLCRHGETDYNLQGKLQGRGIDAPLNAKGLAQADRLGRCVQSLSIGCLVSSSMVRAKQTANAIAAAQICSSATPPPVEILSGLDELSWGELEGGVVGPQVAELRAAWHRGDTGLSAPGGESPDEVLSRAKAAVESVLSKGKRINVFATHGRTIRILLVGLAGPNMSGMDDMEVGNCYVFVVRYYPRTGMYDWVQPHERALPRQQRRREAEAHEELLAQEEL
jgi:broad specificity phosphatase PhoE